MLTAWIVLSILWSVIWVAFVHSLPMWAVWLGNAGFAVFIVAVLGRDWLSRRNVGRRLSAVEHVAEVEYLSPARLASRQRGTHS